MEIKPRKCKHCKTRFVPDRPFQTWCSPECGVELAKAKIAHQKELQSKKQRREYKDAKERIKTRGDYAREAQIAFNAYIRARDNGKPCISCGSHTGKKNAGHYRSVGSCPELRFEESQVHLQCEKCNSYLSGNLINYRTALVQRIGLDKVNWIEGQHEPKKYTIPELKELKEEYSRKLKDLVKLSTTSE